MPADTLDRIDARLAALSTERITARAAGDTARYESPSDRIEGLLRRRSAETRSSETPMPYWLER